MWKISGLLLVGAILTRVYAQEGEECSTPNALPGLCIGIRSCDEILNIILSRNREPRVVRFLQDSTCGYKGQQPLVCCPQPRTQRPVRPTTPPTVPPTQRPTQQPTEATTQGRSAGISEGSAKYKLPKWPNCGLRNDTLGGKVVGGRNAALGEFPWIVALGYRNERNPDNPKYLCGGSLITEKHVLTAGHCIRNDLYMVRAGDLDLYDDDDNTFPQNIPIKRVIRYEQYNAQQHTGDIAILVLATPAKGYFIYPICLPTEEPLLSNSFEGYSPLVAGWGSVNYRGPSSPILQVAQVPVIPLRECVSSYSSFRGATIIPSVLCAAHFEGHMDSCEGDSGGPLVIAHRQGRVQQMYQIGVVSYGHKCAEPGYPGVYTRVTAFVDWIEKNLVD